MKAADEPSDGESPDGRSSPESSEAPGSRRAGVALAGLVLAVFLLGILRLVYPAASVLVIGALLALFGVLVGALAVRERIG